MNTLRRTLERDIVASIWFDPKALSRVRYSVRPEHFSSPLLRRVYEGMLSLLADNADITLANVFLISPFSPSEQRQVELLSVEGQHGNVGLLSRKLGEELIREKLMGFKGSITEEADVFDLLKELHEIEAEATDVIQINSRKDKLETLHEYADHLLTNSKNGVQRIPTGFPTLDRMLCGGLALGDLTLLGGAAGAGKTSIALRIALNAAKNGFKTAFLEGEMTTNEIYERLNGLWTGEDIDTIRAGKEFNQLSQDFISKLFGLPLDIVPAFDRDPYSLSSLINYWANEGAKLIVLDYLQVFAGVGKRANDEFYNIRKVSETMKGLALKRNIHLLVLSALNRNEARSDRLTLNSFYGSSGLGHDCSVAMLLTGDQQDTAEMFNRERNVTLSVVKNRGGIRGDIYLNFHLSNQRMEEVKT